VPEIVTIAVAVLAAAAFARLNGTATTLTFWYEDAPQSRRLLTPDGRAQDTWRIPQNRGDARTRVVRAADSAGALVFCHRYSYQEIETLRFRIELEIGRIDCNQGRPAYHPRRDAPHGARGVLSITKA